MEKEDNHIDELIAKYLAGEAMPEEAIELEEWKKLSPANEAYFNEGVKAFSPEMALPVDTHDLYQRIRRNIEAPGKRKAKKKIFKLQKYANPIRIAATIAVLSWVGLMIAVLTKHSNTPQVLIATTQQTKQQQLVDGSMVYLNKHTRIMVAGKFGKHRKLRLEGEAFFEVKHDDKKPFIIDAGGVTITDIGTAFNVKALPWSDSVMVAVTEGIVELSSGKQLLRLHKDHNAVFIRSTKQLIEIAALNRNITSYKTKIFRFRANKLSEVVSTLNDVYGNIFSVETPAIAACLITVEFRNESPETIAAVIAETLGLRLEKTAAGFQIKGSACVH